MTNKDMKHHLKDLSMNMAKAVQDYAATINKLATHITALWTDLEFNKLRINELNDIIQDKNFEISDLNDALRELETENKELKEVCGGVAHYEKKIKQFIKKESVDN
jgi:chromosome segregation ATPase|tara:strand:- start:701 stop:1018 length:318 start_codon:yes stop_codon:yes gene_type:complete